MPEIVIFGASGMLGTYMTHVLSPSFHVIPITREDFDIVNDTWDKLYQLIPQNAIIINCAEVINTTCSRDYIRVNSIFPHKLEEITNLYKDCQLIHITTDCVFDGTTNGNYTETDEHTESNLYGTSKSCGEPTTSMNIRCALIGESTSKKGLIEWLKHNRNKTVNGYTNHQWNGITCLYLSQFIKNCIQMSTYWIGTRHLYSSTTISKFKLLKVINKVYNLKCNIVPACNGMNVNKVLLSNFNTNVNKTIEGQIIEQRNFNNTNTNTLP